MQVANINAKEIELSVRVLKADGTIVEYGVVDYYHKNPIKVVSWKLKTKLNKFLKGLKNGNFISKYW